MFYVRIHILVRNLDALNRSCLHVMLHIGSVLENYVHFPYSLLVFLKPYSHHPGALLPTSEVNLTGLLVPHNPTLRVMSVSGGPQNVMHGHNVLQNNIDEDHYTYKCEYNIQTQIQKSWDAV